MCYVLLAAMATVLASAEASISATTDSNVIKISKVASVNTAPSTRSLTARGNSNIYKRSLRVPDTDNLDDLDSVDENEEEKAGGTSIVRSIHNIENYRDAKMLRQIAKDNTPEHILNKFKVPYEIINSQRVYSKYDPDYKRWPLRVKIAVGDLDM
ncbi:hypothetical protein BBJ29_001772 [Phytophthora kernoviae]|uniref:RxLR effector protein n=1 Tax=Phytophthora kernoviae TaxID=325452 RepID=A0A421G7A6_9STRA|nr:hypothetical protein BBJ29_001772 [Phytophthora kernoviae]